MTTINTKRVYEPYSSNDGYRILVDKLWPRGESKEELNYDLWAKNVAPSTELREWFHQDEVGRWNDFKSKYLLELRNSTYSLELKKLIKEHKIITLLYSSKNKEMNNALVLKDFLLE